jgi:D-alanyl-D-alanine carboxypeptidase
MSLHPRSVLLAAALIAPAAIFTAACGDSDRPAPRPAAKPAAHATLASRLQQAVDAGAPGAIALVNDGHSVRLYSAGVADKGSGRPLRPTDRFRTGSITKPFVATVALQLVGEGKLSLTDTVEKWLPGVLPYGDHVTLRQLLNHTSGVPDNQDPVDAEWLKGNMTHSWTARELIAYAAGKKPDFAPGAKWAYSNTNYMLVGQIIERATGHRLGRELRQRVLRPLHLRDTSFPIDASTITGAHANGSAFVGNELREVSTLNPSGTWAAGNLVSTASDVAHFWRALLGGRLLAPEQLAAMKTTVPTVDTRTRYGLGVMRITLPCGTVWGHGGDIAGYSNRFRSSEDGKRQAAVIVTSNPAPGAVGEPRGQADRAAMEQALGTHEHC